MNLIELTVPPDILFNLAVVQQNAFVDIDDSYDTGSAGWVSPLDSFDSSQPALLREDWLFTTLRIDERRVPPAVLKRLVAKEERRVRIERQIPRLSRRERVAIRERVHTELIRTAKPVTTLVDVAWNVVSGRVLFFSVSSGALEIFESVFEKTFGVVPRIVPPHAASDDFLAWCWFASSIIELNGRMIIGDGPDQQVAAAPGPEARKALSLGKKIRQAAINVVDRGSCTFSPGVMVYRSVKVPRIQGGETPDMELLVRAVLVSGLIDDIRGEMDQFDVTGMDEWIAEEETV